MRHVEFQSNKVEVNYSVSMLEMLSNAGPDSGRCGHRFSLHTSLRLLCKRDIRNSVVLGVAVFR